MRRRHYRWLTLEFLFYYAVLAYFFLRAFPNAMRVMRRRCVDSPQCRRHFRQGWLPVGYDALPVPGRKQRQGKAGRGGGGGGGWGALHFLAANDLADDQWRDFRGACRSSSPGPSRTPLLRRGTVLRHRRGATLKKTQH